MEFTLTTPALVFSTISLLMLAYTNRFSAVADLIRNLHDVAVQKEDDDIVIKCQLKSLRKRVVLIRNMQFTAIISLFFCVFSMFLLFFEKNLAGEIVFAIALVLLMISLIISAIEINMSVHALNIQLGESKYRDRC